MRTLVAISFVALAGCGHAAQETPPTTTPPPTTTTEAEEADPTCTVPGLETAQPVAFVTLPEGCELMTSGSSSAPQIVHDAAELATVVRCTGTATPSIDLSANDLYAYRYSMGPAYGGGGVVDDGTTITFFERDRPPCPNDPMPMPMDLHAAFLLPKGATRTFTQAACTLPLRCP
jgi:hypothetical protein